MSGGRFGASGMGCRLAAIALFASVWAGCGGQKSSSRPPIPIAPEPVANAAHPDRASASIEAARGPFRFTDIRPDSGVDFVHVSGMTPEKLFPTANGSGVAVFDFNGDGKLDLYFATGNVLPLPAMPAANNRLYKNLGGGKFVDMTEQSGLGFRGYCHGITVGDIDNDGDPDLFLSNYGGDALFVNNGDGTFTEVGRAAGIYRPGTWSSSAAFLDHDGDGDLDLYVSRYGDWEYPRDDQFCGDEARKIRRYCPPATLKPVKHTLFRNNGDRTFTDITDTAGLGRSDGHGFAAVAADLDGDGKTDIYVANDRDPHFLYLNNGNGTFRDVSEDSGAAFDIEGQAQAGMGVDAEDVDGDGRPELFVTNFADEYNTLYRNLGRGYFLDATANFGLAVDGISWIGWGCVLADFDNDGWPDIVVANAEIDDNAESLGKPLGYGQPPLLYWNQGGRRFGLATAGAGAYFEGRHLGHGLAVGDLDEDGDLDLVISHKDGPPAILRNDTPTGNFWIRFDVVGTRGSRDAVGTRVEIEAGGRVINRQKKSGYSLMSAHDPRILVGLGAADVVSHVTIRWPSGVTSTLEHPAVRRTHEIVEPRSRP
jgi:enediyne biosynthesis protein E4